MFFFLRILKNGKKKMSDENGNEKNNNSNWKLLVAGSFFVGMIASKLINFNFIKRIKKKEDQNTIYAGIEGGGKKMELEKI